MTGPEQAAVVPAVPVVPVVPVVLGPGWDRSGGATTYARDLLAALPEARGVVLGPAAGVPGRVTVGGSEDEALPARLLRYGAAAVRAARGAGQPVVLDAHFALLAVLPVLGPLRRLPLVVHFHGPWAQESAAQGAGSMVVLAKRLVERAVYRRAEVLVVLSRAFGDLLVAQYGVDASRVRVVPPGVDLQRFTPDRDGARTRLGLPPDAQVVVTARRLVPRMGLDVLLEAAALLPPGVRVLVAGDGPDRARLQRLAGGRVELLGRVGDEALVDLYRAADVVAVPSLSLEGFGLVVLEALACGTPVVVSDVGGLPEAVAGLGDGLVVPPGDARALAGRLTAALAGQAPGAAACRAHAEGFGWPRAADAHRALYAEATTPALSVVYLDHVAALSGGEIALLRLLTAGLPGVAPRVVLAEDGPLRARLAEAGVPVEVLPLPGRTRDLRRDRIGRRLPLAAALDTARYVLALRRRLLALHPDLVHVNSLKSGLYGALAARAAGVPVVWHVRDRVADDYLPGPAVRLVRAALAALPEVVLANSEATRSTLGRAARRAVVVPDPYLPGPVPVRKAAAGHPLRVGVVGRLAPWKGQDVVLRALAALQQPDVRLAVVGSPLFGEQSWADALRALAVELGVADQVEWRGFREDVAGELARLDVLVHASVVPEPFGQVVVEGMAAGLPVVATAAGGPLEVVRPGVDGLLVPPGDAAALAAALQGLLADPALRARLGAAAQERARDFRPEAVVPGVLAAYRLAVRRG